MPGGGGALPSLRKQRPISKIRSKPPSTNRLSHSSGAILMDSSRSGNSDAEVLNDLAMAPPVPSARMGVSTSVKFRLSRNSRIRWTICDRSRRVCADS